MDRFSRTLRKLNERQARNDVMDVDEAADMMPEAPNDAALFVFTFFAVASLNCDDGPLVEMGGKYETDLLYEGFGCETIVNSNLGTCRDVASHHVSWRFLDEDDDAPSEYTQPVCDKHLAGALEELFVGDKTWAVPIFADLVGVS